MPPASPPDPEILNYIEDQPTLTKAVSAYIKHGTAAKGAASMGINVRNFKSHIARAKAIAALKGEGTPEPARPGFSVKGTTTLYDADGVKKLQWVKVDREQTERLEALQAAMDEMAEKYSKAILVPKPPKKNDLSDLCALYPLGDMHIGLYTAASEVGADWNLEIAENALTGAIDNLAYLTPNAHTGIVADVGDGMHTDNQSNRTPRGGNQLDAAGRYHEIIKVAVETKIRMILRAAQSHMLVHVIVCAGNHNQMGALWMRQVLKYAFAGSSRIKIDTKPTAFHYHRFGQNLFGFTHGDCKAKYHELPGIMATDAREDWGKTKHHVIHTGHVHHDQVKDFRGCRVESHRILAPGDGWHRAQGYRAERSMQAIVYHRERGEVLRHRVGVGQL